ncbi:MAG: potassium-transporting ATPase subunit KdpA, partial [Flavobacteriales bacterium]
MYTEILGIVLIYLAVLAFAWPLGRYIAAVYDGKPHFPDRIFGRAETLLYRLSGVDPAREMGWKEHIKALLLINLLWFFFAMLVLMNQSWLPLNPDQNPDMSPHLAFNTAVSFLVNCNLQHYSGETGLSYFSQIVCIMFLQ